MSSGLPKLDVEGLESFIPEAEIQELLSKKTTDIKKVREIIAKSLDKNRLNPDEMATLLNADDPEIVEEIKEGARTLKKRIYGNRIVLFAPLYVGNDCINNCTYCGFRKSNLDVVRKTLTMKELEKEVTTLENRGHKRLILVYGEHPKYDADFIYDTVRTVYGTKSGNGEIRRVNINAAPFDVEGFRKIKSAGIGTFQVFQETYHQETYRAVHPSGLKANYLWRLFAFDRAMEAGIDDVGMGALIGLYNHKFEALSMLYHTIHLEEKFGVGPHTISFPRMQPALGSFVSENSPYLVRDDAFKRLVTVLRLAVPYTGLIVTARENAALRREIINYGCTQTDASSKIGIGAYAEKQQQEENPDKVQFTLGDERSLDEVIRELAEDGHITSFCTAGYRCGRTGDKIMNLLEKGVEGKFCKLNAVLTFREYLDDYASPETRRVGERLIEQELKEIENMPFFTDKKLLPTFLTYYKRIASGERDLYM